MAPVVIVSEFSRAFDPRADARNVAMVRRRHAWWHALATREGLPIELVDAADVRSGDVDLADARVAWIDLPMLPRARYRTLWETLARRAPAALVRDTPDEVAEVLGLDCIEPRLRSAGVATPRTALVPLDAATATAIERPADVRRLLTERIYEALFAAGLDPHHGLYVRGYYSSAKSSNPELWFARSQDDIEATVCELVRHLRASLEVGGLALRELLDLQRVRLPPWAEGGSEITVPFEFRLTVIAGRCVGASYHGPYEVLAEHQRAALDDALRDHAALLDRLDGVARAVLRAGFPANYVADVAFTTDGSPVVLELNPLYAAGYNVPAAHAWVVASLATELVACAGHARPREAERRAWAEALLGASIDEAPGLRVSIAM